MSDESFFREVTDELRQDKAKAFLSKYGLWLIAIALVIIVVTVGFVLYRHWATERADRSGDVFSQALSLAQDGKNDQALTDLDKIEKNGYGAYPVLARMRAATILADKGDFKGAVKAFDAVSTDGSIPDSVRDIAKLRAAFILVDHGTYDEVSAHVQALTSETNPLRFSAREALGLAAWKAGKLDDALKLFQGLATEETAPRDLRERADLMSGLIRGSGKAS
ncbi:MAG: tetratricopeptide repeat protein [Rhizobiaceae bacterium]|nr:MAG: tetratricopeptide repeat protein [Rhizobiaceae bacterium]